MSPANPRPQAGLSAVDERLRQALRQMAESWNPVDEDRLRGRLVATARRRTRRRLLAAGAAAVVLAGAAVVVPVLGSEFGSSAHSIRAAAGGTGVPGAATGSPTMKGAATGSVAARAGNGLSPCVLVANGGGIGRCAGTLAAPAPRALQFGAAGTSAVTPAAGRPRASGVVASPETTPQAVVNLKRGSTLTVRLPRMGSAVWGAPSAGPAFGPGGNGSAAGEVHISVVARNQASGVQRFTVTGTDSGYVLLQAVLRQPCPGSGANPGCSPVWRVWSVVVLVAAGPGTQG